MGTIVRAFFEVEADYPDQIQQSSEPPWENANLQIDLSLTKTINKSQTLPALMCQLSLECISKYKNHLHIYTDGSKLIDNRVASAFWVPEVEHGGIERIQDGASVMQSELYALQMCLTWANRYNAADGRPIAIFSDSLSALLSLKST